MSRIQRQDNVTWVSTKGQHEDLAYELDMRRDDDLQATVAQGLAGLTLALLEVAEAIREGR